MEKQTELDYISKQIKLELATKLSSAEYVLWIDPLVPYEINDDVMTFIAPTENSANTLKMHYGSRFTEIAINLHLPVTYFFFKTENEIERKKETVVMEIKPPPHRRLRSPSS